MDLETTLHSNIQLVVLLATVGLLMLSALGAAGWVLMGCFIVMQRTTVPLMVTNAKLRERQRLLQGVTIQVGRLSNGPQQWFDSEDYETAHLKPVRMERAPLQSNHRNTRQPTRNEPRPNTLHTESSMNTMPMGDIAASLSDNSADAVVEHAEMKVEITS